MSEDEVVAASIEQERQFPGAILKQAREAQGLSLGEVAGALKFSSRQIEALEADRHDLLQGKTFLRGFVRSYARLLKLSPESLLAMLETEATIPADQIVPPENMGETDPQPFYRRYGKTLGLGFAVVVVAAMLIWQLSQEPQSVASLAEPTQAVTLPQATPETVAQTTGHMPLGVSAVAVAATNPLATGVSAVLGQTTVKPSSADALAFEFSDLSWLEVKDGGGQILLTGEFPAGQRQIANGKPPYHLWIGKASVVKVFYKDQVVNLQSYSRDDVARLTLE